MMRTNFMMIGLIAWTFATAVNWFACKNYLMGGVFICYGVANIFLLIVGRN